MSVDTSVWRVRRELLPGLPGGPLEGESVAVKDLFAVAGERVGGGVPAFLDEQQPARVSAPAVTALTDAGASVAGIARTDEFAYSIAGRNHHYGTPPNPAVPGALPGGSSSGPASAVSLGEATIGLGTDTGGSIRVPASYQGLWGLRTTWNLVDRSGLLPLAPSFDTVGWLTRSPELLAAVARASIPAERLKPAGYRVGVVKLPDDLLEPEVASAWDAFTRALKADAGPLGLVVGDVTVELADVHELFRYAQGHEAWATYGEWIRSHPGSLGPDIAARFEAAARIHATGEGVAARQRIAELRKELHRELGSVVLLLPSASSAAPRADAPDDDLEAVRAATMRLTSVAGVLGRPAVGAPLLQTAAGPVGVSFVGEEGSDVALVELAASVAWALRQD